MRITFRKGKAYDGRARRAESYEAQIDGVRVATLQRHGHKPWEMMGGKDTEQAWFWYGDGVNTAHAPQTLDDCKAAVKAHFAVKAK